MEDPNALNDIRFLRDVVARTQQPSVNCYWPVTLSWGCVITVGYVACGFLGMVHKTAIIPWVMPLLLLMIAWPLHWYLARAARAGIERSGVRPLGDNKMRKDLLCCWLSLSGIGGIWTVALIVSGVPANYALIGFVWGSLYFVGYMMNGALISREWFWAAACLLASLIAVYLAGPRFYWLPGVWMGGSLVLAGLLGRQNVRRQTDPV